jgi:hypothetical protein
MDLKKSEGTKITGIVERRLFDANGNVKAQFKDNALWKLIKGHFGIDLRIPFITGMWTTEALKFNTVTTQGYKVVAQQLGGTTTTPVTAIAIGTGSPGSTALGSEITTGGGARGAATISNTTTTTTGDTEQWVKTFTFTSSFAVTEEGLFDNNSSGGNMVCDQSFSAVNIVSGDSLQITHKVVVS